MFIDIYKFMVVYLALLLIWGAWQSGEWVYLVNGILIAALYALFDVLWTYFRDRVWYTPWASVISGFIIALVGLPDPSWKLIILLPLAAVAIKQLVKIRPRRHIFNPAAAALAVVSLGGSSAVSWWGVAWGQPVLFAVLLVGLYILWYLRRWETAISFLISYALLLVGLFLYQGREFGEILPLLSAQIFDGTVIFFTSVMLIEHVSSNFSGKKRRILYGILVALGAIVFTAFGQYLFELDPLIGGVLTGSFIMSVLTLLI